MDQETNNIMQRWGIGVVLGLVIILGGFGLWRWFQSTPSSEGVDPNESAENIVINDIYFGCDNGKSVYAKFYKNKVDLDLSDGRKITIPQTISASGTRYANIDESFVFWNKGDTAFIQEKSSSGLIKTFDNCVGGKG